MRTSFLSFVVVGLAGVVLGRWLGSRPEGDARGTARETWSLPEELGCWSLVDGARLVARDELLEVRASFTCGGTVVVLERSERPSADQPWDRQRHVLVADWPITDVDAREGGTRLVVAGVDARGDAPRAVLEEWTLDFLDGAVAWTSPPPPPVGEPAVADYVAEVRVGVRGDRYRLPTRRAGHVPLQERRTLAVLQAGETISAVAVDPEGRFVLFRTLETGAVRQLELVGDAEPRLVFTPEDEPALAAQDGPIQARQVAGVGRVYRMLPGPRATGPAAGRSVFLIDRDNDARFDACEVVEADALAGSPLLDTDLATPLRRTSG